MYVPAGAFEELKEEVGTRQLLMKMPVARAHDQPRNLIFC